MNILSLGAGLDTKGGSGADSSARQGRAQFELRIGVFMKRELEVVSFEGHEKLSNPYVYDVAFASSVPMTALQLGVFGFPACLSVQAPNHETRVIQGLAVGFEAVGAADGELKTKTRRYATRIVPRLWLLNHSRKYRVFQDKSAVQIARAVLDDAGITPKIALERGDYPPIPFVYQRGETDLEFLHHVLAVAGIFYYFEHASGWLDQLVPGAGEIGAIAGGLGGVAASAMSMSGGFGVSGAGSSLSASFSGDLDGGIASGLGAAGASVGTAASTLGLTTTLVLCDRTRHTAVLHDTSNAASTGMFAAAGLGAALASTAGGAFGAVAGAVGDLASQAGGALADAIPYDGNGQASTSSERVFSFRARSEVRPKSVTLCEWNLAETKPVRMQEENEAAELSLDPDATVGAAVAFAGQGSASLGPSAIAALDIDALPIATKDVSVAEYQRDAALLAARDSFAERALSQLRGDRVTARGESDCRRLAPGYRFNLAQHPIAPVNGEYVVTELRSTGYAPDHLPEENLHLYRNEFACVPVSIDPRPAKPAPRPPLGPETAVVVGPAYGDVHCDSIGRILVRFRWAEGAAADKSQGTCWVKWQEPWAGNGYGTRHLPRVGSEVIVHFFQQDGGQPIATGQIYSRANAPPFPLPREAPTVGIRSSVIGGAGYSELALDDATGDARLRAARDQRTDVVRDEWTNVGGDRHINVAGVEEELVAGDVKRSFRSDVTDEVAGNAREEVGKDRSATVQGSVNEYVGGDASRVVVGRVAALTKGPHSQTFGADALVRHFGHRTVVVAAAGGDGQASTCFHVEGPARAYAKKEIEVSSPEGFTFTCGDSCITIRKDSVTISSPTITLLGKTVQVTASDTAAFAAKTVTVAGSDSVTISGANKATLAGQSATVVLDANATIQGSAVKLGSGGGGTSSQATSPTKKPPTRLVLNDQKGEPLANARVIVRTGGDGGPERVVVLDADGSFETDGDGPIDVRFPEQPDAH